MNNVSVRLVFDRKHVATKKRQSSVQMEVTYQRKRKYVGTGIKLYSDQWGKDLKVKNHPQSLVFNQKLNDMVSGIYDFVYQLSSQNIPFTFERLERYLNNSESGFSSSMKKSRANGAKARHQIHFIVFGLTSVFFFFGIVLNFAVKIRSVL